MKAWPAVLLLGARRQGGGLADFEAVGQRLGRRLHQTKRRLRIGFGRILVIQKGFGPASWVRRIVVRQGPGLDKQGACPPPNVGGVV